MPEGPPGTAAGRPLPHYLLPVHPLADAGPGSLPYRGTGEALAQRGPRSDRHDGQSYLFTKVPA